MGLQHERQDGRTRIFQMALRFRVLPPAVEAMNAGQFAALEAYLVGLGEGEAIRARQRR